MKINELKLAIFAGHGGADPGASSTFGKESDKTLELMLEATKYAKSLGIKVVNNRTTNTARNISADAKKADKEKVDGVIEIHFDSATETAQGTTGFYCEGSTSSKNLAQKINDRVDDYFKNRGIKPDTSTRHGRLGILRETNAPAMLLETCFISNKVDMTTYKEKKLLIAQAIVHGALDYFNIPLPAKGKGKKRVWVKEPKGLNIRTGGGWDSKVAFNLPYTYTAIIDYDQTLNGFVKVIWGEKEGWFSAAFDAYWFDKDPCIEYVCQTGLNFRAGQDWNTKVVQSRKKGDTVRVIGQVNKWYKVVLSGGVVGYIPVNNLYLKKK